MADEDSPWKGVVRGGPRSWLRIEGCVLLASTLVAYGALHQWWWFVPLGILVPDLAILGYLRGPRLGALVYNIAHATPLPVALLGLAWRSDTTMAAVGLVWLAHIAMDRALGFGLKYSDDFGHTHLSASVAPDDTRRTDTTT